MSQQLENLHQNIDSNGDFYISTYSQNYYNSVIKDSLQLVKPIKNNGEISFQDLEKIFPDIVDGQCIIIDDENFKPRRLKICETHTDEKTDTKTFIVNGRLTIDSSFAEYYILRYYFSEMGGYYILNAKTNEIHQVFHRPIFSPDKKMIISYFCDYRSFSLTVIDLETDRRLYYLLSGGKFFLNKIDLVKIDSYRKKQIFIDLTQIIDFNEDYQQIDEKKRSIKLRIQ